MPLSMADVFVTAVFVAFLSANAAPATMAAQVEPGQIRGPAKRASLSFGLLSSSSFALAHIADPLLFLLSAGFYWFLSYYALSLLALQLMTGPALRQWQQDGGDETDMAADCETAASAHDVDGDPHDDDLDRLEQMEEHAIRGISRRRARRRARGTSARDSTAEPRRSRLAKSACTSRLPACPPCIQSSPPHPATRCFEAAQAERTRRPCSRSSNHERTRDPAGPFLS